MYVCIHVRMYVCMYACMYNCVTHICTHTYIHIYHVHAHTHVHTHIYIYNSMKLRSGSAASAQTGFERALIAFTSMVCLVVLVLSNVHTNTKDI